MSAPFTPAAERGFRIISADERLAEIRMIKAAIFGGSGQGKTSLLWTLLASTTLFFDLEAGDLAVEGWPGDTIRPRTWQECRDFAVFIGGPNPALRDDQPYSAAHHAAVCERFGDPASLDRYLRFNGWLQEIARLGGPFHRIVFEEVRRHIGTDAAHVFGGLLATLTAWAEMHSIPYEGVPVGTIKRFATGKGNADKAAVIAAMKAHGFSPADDNEADALALLLWATSAQGGQA